jgi:hypothetical protein
MIILQFALSARGVELTELDPELGHPPAVGASEECRTRAQ